jgi:AraC-like DNA-binding protein
MSNELNLRLKLNDVEREAATYRAVCKMLFNKMYLTGELAFIHKKDLQKALDKYKEVSQDAGI